MINKDFLKQLTILYVEDDDTAREQFGKYLKRLFKEVILGSNGEDGYTKFQDARLKSKNIDLILSDINMPKMNGLEMLEKIRKVDENVPVMYTTARTETEYLQKAIELNVNHYALKPINLEDIIIRIQRVCEKQYFQMVIDSKNQELKNYLTIINNVAAIFKMNEEGEITFINDLFCNLFNQKKETLLENSLSTLMHSNISKDLINEIFGTIQKDETWHGDIKYENASEESFFIRSSIFKVMKENTFEYISVGFLSTHEVEKQRDFHKKVLSTISHNNKESSKSKNELERLRDENSKLQASSEIFDDQMKKTKEKLALAQSQIKHYEKEILETDKRLDKRIALRNQEKNELMDSLTLAKKENKLLFTQNQRLKENSLDNIKEFEMLKDTISQKEKRIEAVKDVLAHRESQIRKLNPDLLS